MVTISFEWLATSLYIAITVIGTSLSIKKKENLWKTEGMFKNALKKSLFLFIVREIMNIIIEVMNKNKVGMWHVVGMNMITDVALVEILTYGIIKIPRKWKLGILLLLLIVYPVLLSWCLKGMNYDNSCDFNITSRELTQLPFALYYLLFNFEAMEPMMSWLIVVFLTSLVFDGFVAFQGKVMALSQGKQQRKRSTIVALMRYHSQRLFLTGILLVAFSVIFGGTILSKGIGATAWIYRVVMNCDVWCYLGGLQGMPMIIIWHTPHALIFNIGLLSMAFATVQYVRYMQGRPLFLEKALTYCGLYSFSIFLYGHALAFIGPLPLVWLIVTMVSVIGGMIVLVTLWAEKARGIGSLEWLMGLYSKALKLTN